MPKFACSEWLGGIWQVDSTQPLDLPYPVHQAHSDIDSLAFRADKEFVLAWGTTPDEIRQTTGASAEIKLYDHNKPIWCVRVRNVAGTDRVYFSAPRMDTTLQGVDIYVLKGGVASLYTAIDQTQMTFPHPCDPSQEAYDYQGDFAFGDGDVLYLSTGNWSGFPIGIYRISGAGPDTVTGTVERIFLTEGPIENLCFESPHTLYFMRPPDVWKLDLSTMAETFVMSIKLPEGRIPLDITLVGEGLPPAWWWGLVIVWVRALNNLAAALWRLAVALVRRGAGDGRTRGE
jgi:hypothetical protein